MLRFLKLGGSLITDKNQVETARYPILEQAAQEIAVGLAATPDIQLIVGHGSGSYGHVAAQRYETRQGVYQSGAWRGFAEVSLVASRLNALVSEALHAAGVPVLRLQPSASAHCRGGLLVSMETGPIRRALDAGLVPLLYGDVAFDREIGGTIISTEEIFAYLARDLRPESIWLAGEVPGVLDNQQRLVTSITSGNFEHIQEELGESRGIDVTGGMASKVRSMLDLCANVPGLSVHIFSGLEASFIQQAVTGRLVIGTTIRSG